MKKSWFRDSAYGADRGGRRLHSPLEGHFRLIREGMSQKPSVFCAKADAVGGMLLKYKLPPPARLRPCLADGLSPRKARPSRGEWVRHTLSGGCPLKGPIPTKAGLLKNPVLGASAYPRLACHRIDFTLSSHRRSNATEKGAFVSKGATFRCAPVPPRYGARARLLGMREERHRGSNASYDVEKAFVKQPPCLSGG